MKLRNRVVYKTVRNLISLVARIFLRVKVRREGKHLPGPKIYAVNHPTEIDMFPVFVFTKDIIHTMINPYIFDLPVIRTILRWTEQIKIRRNTRKHETIEEAQKVLRNGEALLIAPQGARVKFNEYPRPKRGVVRLALENRVPIIPVGIGIPQNKIRIKRVFFKEEKIFRDSYIPRFRAPYGIVFGEPISFERYYGKKIDRETLQNLADKVMGHNLQAPERSGKNDVLLIVVRNSEFPYISRKPRPRRSPRSGRGFSGLRARRFPRNRDDPVKRRVHR